MRTNYFPSLNTPALFVHGSGDPFASTEELRAALELIPARTALIEVEGAGHELAHGKFEIAKTVLRPLRELLPGLIGSGTALLGAGGDVLFICHVPKNIADFLKAWDMRAHPL